MEKLKLSKKKIRMSSVKLEKVFEKLYATYIIKKVEKSLEAIEKGDVYTLDEIRKYSQEQKNLLWDELFRLEYPHIYYVDLTKNLLDYKLKMLASSRGL